MTYNTKREPMALPEYGRHIHDIVRLLLDVKDRGERQKRAEAVASIMARKRQETEEHPDSVRTAWDHLAHIAGPELDIDYPYPVTPMGAAAPKPKRLSYPRRKATRMQYGRLIEEFLSLIAGMEEGEAKQTAIEQIATRMKQTLFVWDREAMDNAKIAADIRLYTSGKISIDPDTFRFGTVHTLPRQDSELTTPRKRRK